MSEKVELFVVQRSGPFRQDWMLVYTYDGVPEMWSDKGAASQAALTIANEKVSPWIAKPIPVRTRVLRIPCEVVDNG